MTSQRRMGLVHPTPSESQPRKLEKDPRMFYRQGSKSCSSSSGSSPQARYVKGHSRGSRDRELIALPPYRFACHLSTLAMRRRCFARAFAWLPFCHNGHVFCAPRPASPWVRVHCPRLQSTFAQALERHIPQFRRCNQDELGDRRSVEALTRQSLREGRSVVVDRTNFDERCALSAFYDDDDNR